jgi:hypothetical protein
MPVLDLDDSLVNELVYFERESLCQSVHCTMDLGEGTERKDNVFDVTERITFGVDI